MVNQGCMSLSTYIILEYGRHVARLRRHHHRRYAYEPTSNAANHDNHEKINSWISFSFLYEYGAPLSGPLGRQSSTITTHTNTRKETKNEKPKPTCKKRQVHVQCIWLQYFSNILRKGRYNYRSRLFQQKNIISGTLWQRSFNGVLYFN